MTIIKTKIEELNTYEELVSRLEHIDRAFIVRRHIKLHYSSAMPKETTDAYIKMIRKYSEFFGTFEESLLWYIPIELCSRFLATGKRSSKKGLWKFIQNPKNKCEIFKNKIDELLLKHESIIKLIEKQRDKFFAHKDNIPWVKFEKVFDNEFEALLSDLKELLDKIGEHINERRRSTPEQKIAKEQTCQIFDDLLSLNNPRLDVDRLQSVYNTGVEEFLKL